MVEVVPSPKIQYQLVLPVLISVKVYFSLNIPEDTVSNPAVGVASGTTRMVSICDIQPALSVTVTL